MESGANPVPCPVCTLYLREGVTLQNHLNTHPKDQVIAALVRVSAVTKDSQTNAETPSSSSQQQEEFASSGSSHFTTAITYQEYLSSNGSGTQYISLPTILSAPSAASQATANQTAFMQMVYNPYVIQQQQQQQFQLLSSVTTPVPQPFIRHVVPSYPSHPVTVPFQTSTTFASDFPSQSFQNAISLSSVIPLPASTSASIVACSVPNSNTVPVSQSEKETGNKTSSSENRGAPNQQNVTSSCSTENKTRRSKITGVATQTIQCEEEDQKSPKDEENQEVLEKEIEQVDSPKSDGVRVRTDLNDVAVSPMGSSELIDQDLDEQLLNRDLSQIPCIIRNSLRIQSPPIPPSEPTVGEYITYDQPEGEECNSNKEDPGVKTKTDEENTKFLDLDSSETVNIIEIDGIHILVPSEFLEKSAAILESSEEPPRETEADASSVNIQTDETMPPRGELSEQESNGGNESSMWVQAFQEKEVSTSYDLLARESWEASDVSDADIPIETNTIVRRKTQTRRIYKCATCGERFNCPKERRVHQSTFHSNKSTGNGAETSGVKKSVNGNRCEVKVNISQDVETDKKQHQPQFMEVFLAESLDANIMSEDREMPSPVSTVTSQMSSPVSTVTSQMKSPVCTVTSQPEVKKEESASESKQEDVTVQTEFPCSSCDLVFKTTKLLTTHERKSHKKPKQKKNVCGTCNEVFPTDAEFHTHLQLHPYECSQCGKYFYRRQNLDLHLRRHLGIKPHKCTVCDKSFVTKQKLTEHTNSHTGNAPIKCPMCDETFRRYSNLIQHKQRHHLNIKKKVKDFICHCGEIFHSKKKLEWHKEIHEEKPKCCTYCSERFVHSASLTRHIRKAHDCRYVPKCGREGENVECTVCGYVFLKSSMAVHMRMHTGERPYPCHVCGKNFTTKWNLQLHRWTHAARSTKPFKCSLCKSAFFRRNDYTAHMHSHRNVRPYTCNHCGCQFIRKYNCLRHVREHEVGKSFTCTVCGKTFHRSYYLKEHMRVHSGARPFACHICGKASSTKSNHNKHIKIHHAREPVNTEG